MRRTEFMTGGARLLLMSGAGAKSPYQPSRRRTAANPVSVHTVQPRVLSLTQATELGTVYTQNCRRSPCTMRTACWYTWTALASPTPWPRSGCSPAEITWQAGVDVLSFGATKNGALAAEAVVFFDPARVADFELRRKRAGHLLSKMRFVYVAPRRRSLAAAGGSCKHPRRPPRRRRSIALDASGAG
jgi:threonine aldolase